MFEMQEEIEKSRHGKMEKLGKYIQEYTVKNKCAKIILEKKLQVKIRRRIRLFRKDILHITHQELMLALLIGKEMKSGLL